MLKKSFTLVEILVSITIILIMTAVMSVVFLEKEEEIRLFSFKNELIAELRYTQIRSMNMLHNYGINVATNNIILFRDVDNSGDYTTIIGEKIRNINVPEGIILSPISDIVFQKDGSVFNNIDKTITMNLNGFSKNILINSLGLIERGY